MKVSKSLQKFPKSSTHGHALLKPFKSSYSLIFCCWIFWYILWKTYYNIFDVIKYECYCCILNLFLCLRASPITTELNFHTRFDSSQRDDATASIIVKLKHNRPFQSNHNQIYLPQNSIFIGVKTSDVKNILWNWNKF